MKDPIYKAIEVAKRLKGDEQSAILELIDRYTVYYNNMAFEYGEPELVFDKFDWSITEIVIPSLKN